MSRRVADLTERGCKDPIEVTLGSLTESHVQALSHEQYEALRDRRKDLLRQHCAGGYASKTDKFAAASKDFTVLQSEGHRRAFMLHQASMNNQSVDIGAQKPAANLHVRAKKPEAVPPKPRREEFSCGVPADICPGEDDHKMVYANEERLFADEVVPVRRTCEFRQSDYRCPVCNAGFSSSDALLAHGRFHCMKVRRQEKHKVQPWSTMDIALAMPDALFVKEDYEQVLRCRHYEKRGQGMSRELNSNRSEGQATRV